MLPTLVGLRDLRSVTFSSEGFPGDLVMERICGAGATVSPLGLVPSHLWQIKFKGSHRIQQISVLGLSCCWSILSCFFSFSLLFSVFCNIAREEPGKKGR